MRLSGKKWLDLPATIYVNGMRSIPLVMVILWFFLLMPMLIGKPIGAETSAIITFVAFEAAYFSRSCAPASSPFHVARCLPARRWA
jgi:glutamate/aspartate transport system permease protein